MSLAERLLKIDGIEAEYEGLYIESETVTEDDVKCMEDRGYIFEHAFPETCNGWLVEDFGNLEYCRKNTDGTYDFIMRQWLDSDEDGKHFIVKYGNINLNDYDRKSRENAISGYYKSLEELEAEYDNDEEEINQVIAENIFELMDDSQAYVTDYMTATQAAIYIFNYIKEH